MANAFDRLSKKMASIENESEADQEIFLKDLGLFMANLPDDIRNELLSGLGLTPSTE